MNQRETLMEQENYRLSSAFPRILNMDTYARKNHFEYFKNMAYPYVGVTVNVDITEFLAGTKEKKQPFFLSFPFFTFSPMPPIQCRSSDRGFLKMALSNTDSVKPPIR